MDLEEKLFRYHDGVNTVEEEVDSVSEKSNTSLGKKPIRCGKQESNTNLILLHRFTEASIRRRLDSLPQRNNTRCCQAGYSQKGNPERKMK